MLSQKLINFKYSDKIISALADCLRGEMDIIFAFEANVGSSNLSGGTYLIL